MKNFKNYLFTVFTVFNLLSSGIIEALFAPDDINDNPVRRFNRLSRPGQPINALDDWFEHPEYLEARDEDGAGETPMHALANCALDNDVACVALIERLYAAGAHIDAIDNLGKSPLHYAIEYGEGGLPVVEKLIALGANVNAGDEDGRRPLDFAADNAAIGIPNAAEYVIVLIQAGAEHSADWIEAHYY